MKGKSKINSEVNEKICGYVNSNGGYIVFGINEDYNLPAKRRRELKQIG